MQEKNDMKSKPENEQYVFGLDIGTRSVVGTVGYRINADKFAVCTQYVKEHETITKRDFVR